MFYHYIKSVLAYFKKDKINLLINIFCLSVGLACFLTVLSFKLYENSYDDFHSKKRFIYRVNSKIVTKEDTHLSATSCSPIASLLKNSFPQIEESIRFSKFPKCVLSNDLEIFNEKQFLFTDSQVFNVFDFRLKKGDHEKALSEPFTVVLTEEMSYKYFGNDDPIGKEIKFYDSEKDTNFLFLITGILDEIPSNSHIKIDFLASYSSLSAIVSNDFDNNWVTNIPTWVYILIKDNNSRHEIERLLPNIVENHLPQISEDMEFSYFLKSLDELYFDQGNLHGYPIGDFGLEMFSRLLFVVGVLVLVISCINYMNYSIARSITRKKELGIRKTLGANKYILIKQLLSESIIFSVIIFLISIPLILLLLPNFINLLNNALSLFSMLPERKVGLTSIINLNLVLTFFIVIILMGIVTGIFPAVISARYNPIQAIKDDEGFKRSSLWLRKSFLFIQFSLSIILIIVTLFLNSQIAFLKSKDLGIKKDNVLVIQIENRNLREGYQTLKNSLLQRPYIKSVSASSQNGNSIGQSVYIKNTGDNEKNASLIYTDFDYIKTLGIDLISGNDLYQDSDFKNSVIINRAAYKESGLAPDQFIEIYADGDSERNKLFYSKICGIVDDFSFYPIFEGRVKPVIIKIDNSRLNQIYIKFSEGYLPQVVNDLRYLWKELNYTQAFEYIMLDEDVAKSYRIVDLMGTFFVFITVISIIISVFALFTILIYIIERRTKEIAIRKVLGANLYNIIILITKFFRIPLLLAIIFSYPVAYVISESLIQTFPYRISISPYLFILVTMILGIIISLSVFIHIKRILQINMTENLQSE